MADIGDGEEYLVRGALLKCSAGTHPRRLNLMKDHGVQMDTEEYNYPFVHEMDCVPGPTGNVDYFGICNNIPENPSSSITLQAVDENNQLTGGVVTGMKCTPSFVPQKWNQTKEDTRLGGLEGQKMVTMKSCLMCPLGGKITPVTSGREYKGEQDS